MGPGEALPAGDNDTSGFCGSITGPSQQFTTNVQLQRYNTAINNDASIRTLNGSAESSPLDRQSAVHSRSSTDRLGSMPAEGTKGRFDIHYSHVIPGEKNSLRECCSLKSLNVLILLDISIKRY